MKIFWKSLAALLFLVLGVWAIGSEGGPDAVATPLAAHPHLETAVAGDDPAWRASPLWDDDSAEYCAYDVRQPLHGRLRSGRAVLVLAREPHADLLKLNHIRDLPAGFVPLHQMASMLLRRDSGALVQMAASSSEAAGLATAEILGGRLTTQSFVDRGAGASRDTPFPGGALPEDGLPASLRGYVPGSLPVPAALTVFPSLLTARNAGLAATVYRLQRSESVAETPEGRLPAVALRLTADGRSRIYTFDKASPHRLLRLESSDGTLYEMARCARIPFGKIESPGDETGLPGEVQG